MAAPGDADGCRSIALADVVSVDYLGPAPSTDDPVDESLVILNLFRVGLRMEPAIAGADAPRSTDVTLRSTEAVYLRRPGRILLIYDVRGGQVEALHWTAVRGDSAPCITRTRAERLGVAHLGRMSQDESDICFDRD